MSRTHDRKGVGFKCILNSSKKRHAPKQGVKILLLIPIKRKSLEAFKDYKSRNTKKKDLRTTASLKIPPQWRKHPQNLFNTDFVFLHFCEHLLSLSRVL